jgi:hypothetical protein
MLGFMSGSKLRICLNESCFEGAIPNPAQSSAGFFHSDSGPKYEWILGDPPSRRTGRVDVEGSREPKPYGSLTVRWLLAPSKRVHVGDTIILNFESPAGDWLLRKDRVIATKTYQPNGPYCEPTCQRVELAPVSLERR